MLKKHFLLLSIPLKTIELLNVLVETMTHVFKISWWIECSTVFCLSRIFFNNILSLLVSVMCPWIWIEWRVLVVVAHSSAYLNIVFQTWLFNFTSVQMSLVMILFIEGRFGLFNSFPFVLIHSSLSRSLSLSLLRLLEELLNKFKSSMKLQLNCFKPASFQPVKR